MGGFRIGGKPPLYGNHQGCISCLQLCRARFGSSGAHSTTLGDPVVVSDTIAKVPTGQRPPGPPGGNKLSRMVGRERNPVEWLLLTGTNVGTPSIVTTTKSPVSNFWSSFTSNTEYDKRDPVLALMMSVLLLPDAMQGSSLLVGIMVLTISLSPRTSTSTTTRSPMTPQCRLLRWRRMTVCLKS